MRYKCTEVYQVFTNEGNLWVPEIRRCRGGKWEQRIGSSWEDGNEHDFEKWEPEYKKLVAAGECENLDNSTYCPELEYGHVMENGEIYMGRLFIQPDVIVPYLEANGFDTVFMNEDDDEVVMHGSTYKYHSESTISFVKKQE